MSDPVRPRVAIVVGSGGIKTIASIPLFELIEEAGIDVDLLVACSGGSIFAGWWATCGSAAHMRENVRGLWTRELFRKPDHRTLLAISGLPFGRFDKTHGLLKPHAVHETLRRTYGDQRMEDLPIRTILLATGLLSGHPVRLTSGLLRETVYASAALFPILPPIQLEGEWLIDGGYSSPLPILTAVNEGADVIITFTNQVRTEDEARSFIGYLTRCMSYSATWLTRNQTTVALDMHHHEIVLIDVVFDDFIGLRDVDRIPDILNAGARAVEAKKREILAAIESCPDQATR